MTKVDIYHRLYKEEEPKPPCVRDMEVGQEGYIPRSAVFYKLETGEIFVHSGALYKSKDPLRFFGFSNYPIKVRRIYEGIVILNYRTQIEEKDLRTFSKGPYAYVDAPDDYMPHSAIPAYIKEKR